MNFLIDINFLKENKFEPSILKLENNPIDYKGDAAVVFLPPDPSCLENLSNIKKNSNKKFAAVFIPKISYEIQAMIDRSEILNSNMEIYNLPIDMFPLDYDILSLEFNEFNYLQPNNSLPILAKSIQKLETVYGKIKHKYAKGDSAVLLSNLLSKEESIFETENQILAGIMIDRSVDFITPMCTVNTYEGLIDEYLGITLNTIRRPELIENDPDKVFSSKNEFYEKIRDCNFSYVRNYIPQKFQNIMNIMKEARESTDTDMRAIAEGLEKVKLAQVEFKPCKTHINLATHIRESHDLPINIEILKREQPMLAGELPETLYDFYENAISQQKHIWAVLKLMCLESLIFAGIRPKLYDQLKRDFLLVMQI